MQRQPVVPKRHIQVGRNIGNDLIEFHYTRLVDAVDARIVWNRAQHRDHAHGHRRVDDPGQVNAEHLRIDHLQYVIGADHDERDGRMRCIEFEDERRCAGKGKHIRSAPARVRRVAAMCEGVAAKAIHDAGPKEGNRGAEISVGPYQCRIAWVISAIAESNKKSAGRGNAVADT